MAESLSLEEFTLSLANVLVCWPLYRTYRFKGYVLQETLGQRNGFDVRIPYVVAPDEISLSCNRCDQEQRWRLTEPCGYNQVGWIWTIQGFTKLVYGCKNCESETATFLILTNITKAGGSIVKVGQFPALEREPSRGLASALHLDDLALYRHALTCRNSNFGIGAVAYLRRIVENRINDLLDLVVEAAEMDDTVARLRQDVKELKADRRFSEKIAFAAKLLPKSLVRGSNPIATLPELTSAGLHGESDDE
jgi:hypothetical protein